MFWNRYKIMKFHGSTVLLYRSWDSTDIYKSIRSAMNEPIWHDNIDHECIVSKEDVADVDWLKPHLKKAVKSIIIKHKGIIEVLIIVKVKCK